MIIYNMKDTKKLLMLAMMLMMAVAAGAKEKGATEAHFSQFIYTGQDDYYQENPLTDAAQFYNPILPGWYSDPAICRVGPGPGEAVPSATRGPRSRRGCDQPARPGLCAQWVLLL